MTRELLLLRHAKAARDDAGLDDYDRPLTARGRAAAAHMGKSMRRMGLDPDLVLCSTAARTQATLLLALQELGWKRDVRLARGLYLAEMLALLEALRAAPQKCRSILLIGHNPGLEDLAALLSRPGVGATKDLERLRTKFPTAGLAVLDVAGTWETLQPESAVLREFLTPPDRSDGT